MIETFEANDTRQFTFTSSNAPDSAPSFAVFNNAGTLVASMTSQSSSSTAYYTMYTMPSSSDGIYAGEWKALSTVVSSQYQFVKRFLFRVTRTEES